MLVECVVGWCLVMAALTKTQLPNRSDGYFLREHSLIKPFSSLNMDTPLWDYSGDTIISNSEIRITPDRASKSGRIWNSIPMMSRNWEVVLQFKVHGAGKTLYGDGFALWYTSGKQLMSGDIFGAANKFTGLGIFFDTYSNHNGEHNHGHPYISGVVFNGTQQYDHDSDGTHNEIAGCQSSFRQQTGGKHETYASIKYINNVLTVHHDVKGKNKWAKCFEEKNVILPIGYHLGLSASTGQLADNHDVVMLKAYELKLEPDQTFIEEEALKLVPSAEGEPDRPRIEDEQPLFSRRVKTIFYVCFGLIFVLVIGGIGYHYYQKYIVARHKKRFY